MSDIVISGIGGRYPMSDNVEQFWSNLLSGVEMSTIDDSRYEPGKSTVKPRYRLHRLLTRCSIYRH